MQIQSVTFSDNEFIPSQYTCEGENISPPLLFLDIPENTQSLVLIVDDSDAVSRVWTHWLVFNIPPTTHKFAENTTPPGIEGMTSFGRSGWGGPCPPNQPVHHYRFKLYALDIEIEHDASVDRAVIEQAMEGHILDETQLIGLYQKTK